MIHTTECNYYRKKNGICICREEGKATKPELPICQFCNKSAQGKWNIGMEILYVCKEHEQVVINLSRDII